MRFAPVLVLLAACGGSKKQDTTPPPPPADPAPAQPEAAQPRAGGPTAEDCDKLIEHALDLIEKSPQFTEADKEQIRKQRAQGDVKGSPEWKNAQGKCMQDMKKEDVQCALAAKDFEEMNKCGGAPPAASPPPGK